MPWGRRATSALANTREAPGSDSTVRYLETISAEATAGPASTMGRPWDGT
jgi:hypothetical protein